MDPPLRYITTVLIPAQNAQSRQVVRMAKAFSKHTDTLLITPETTHNQQLRLGFPWTRVAVPSLKKSIRTYYLLKTKKEFLPSGSIIYTRDIAIASVFALRGFVTVFEAHKEFLGAVPRLLAAMFRKRLRIVTISEALRQFFINIYQFSPKQVLSAHDAVDPSLFEVVHSSETTRVRFGLPLNSFIALYCGSIYPGRGIEYIIDAAHKHLDALFCIVGTYDKTSIDPAVLPKNIRMLGGVEDELVPSLLKAADVLLMPYTTETATFRWMSPLKLFEYMASGVPIISSNIGSLLEVLNDRNSILFDPQEANALANALSYVRMNYKEAKIRASFALQDVLQQYTWDKRAVNILSFIRGTVDE